MTSGSRLAARLALDSSAYSHLRGDDARVRSHVAAAAHVIIPATVLGELHAGFAAGGRLRENQVRLAEFLEGEHVDIAVVDQDVARRYGQIFAALRRKGTPVSVNDMWIAATVIERAAHLLTFDTTFRRIEGLDVTILEPAR